MIKILNSGLDVGGTVGDTLSVVGGSGSIMKRIASTKMPSSPGQGLPIKNMNLVDVGIALQSASKAIIERYTKAIDKTGTRRIYLFSVVEYEICCCDKSIFGDDKWEWRKTSNESRHGRAKTNRSWGDSNSITAKAIKEAQEDLEKRYEREWPRYILQDGDGILGSHDECEKAD